MAYINKQNKELLQEMEGIEITSHHYNDVVGINNNNVIARGVIIDTLNSNKKIITLWNEYMREEGMDANEIIKEFSP